MELNAQQNHGFTSDDPDKVIANIPGIGPITQKQMNAAERFKDDMVRKIREIAVTKSTEEIVNSILIELRRSQMTKMFFEMTREMKFFEDVAKSVIIIQTLEQVLLERFGGDIERCKNKQCDDCPVKMHIEAALKKV